MELKIKTIREKLTEIIRDVGMNLDIGHRMAMYEERHKGLTLQQLAAEMKVVEDVIDYIDAIGKHLTAEYDTIRLKLIPDKMDSENIESPFTVTGVGRVVLTPDAYVRVPADKQEALYKWLRENNLGDLIQGSVNASTLKASVKGWMKKGTPYPTDIISVTPFTRASITKAK